MLVYKRLIQPSVEPFVTDLCQKKIRPRKTPVPGRVRLQLSSTCAVAWFKSRHEWTLQQPDRMIAEMEIPAACTPDANHGAGIWIPTFTPKMTQFCRYIEHMGTGCSRIKKSLGIAEPSRKKNKLGRENVVSCCAKTSGIGPQITAPAYTRVVFVESRCSRKNET